MLAQPPRHNAHDASPSSTPFRDNALDGLAALVRLVDRPRLGLVDPDPAVAGQERVLVRADRLVQRADDRVVPGAVRDLREHAGVGVAQVLEELGLEPADVADRDVVVLGMGNSAMDIAVDASYHARATYLAARRGAYVIPKYLFGKPVDQIGGAEWLPYWIRFPIMAQLLKFNVGRMENYGLPEPDHKFAHAHPTISGRILDRLRDAPAERDQAARQAKREAAEKAKIEAAERAQREAAEKAEREAARKVEREAAKEAKREAARVAKMEASAQAKREAAEKVEAEREAGETENVIRRQVEAIRTVVDDDNLDRLAIAYEPVWAIGTGLTASPDQAQEIHAFIRGLVKEKFGTGIAEGRRIQYGGSVKPDNARDLLSRPDIDGALVGGASLVAADFEAIVKAAKG